MKAKLIALIMVAFLLGCENSAAEFADREAAYNRSLECYKANDGSDDCKLAYQSLIAIERRSVTKDTVEEYKNKYCSGLNADFLLCEVGKIIANEIQEEEYARFEARVDYYLNNRAELQKTYNTCGVKYYEKAGISRDGTWIGASGTSKLLEAMKTFSEDFNWECKASVNAANRLKIKYAHYFVETL